MLEITKEANGIATITLNRPEKHNAFDDVLIQQMTSAFHDVEADETIRLVILAAKGKHFSAGGDLAWMKRSARFDYDDNLKDAKALADMLKTLNFLSKPTIARVQGAAFGGAVGLISCCDIAIASESANFCLSEVKIGLIPATISPYVIAVIGERAARRYMLSAERFSAEQALKLGLVSEVCSTENLDQTITSVSQHLLANSPAALSACKDLIAQISNRRLDQSLIDETSKRIAEIRSSKEGQEGLSAFLEKRVPAWLTSATSPKGQ